MVSELILNISEKKSRGITFEQSDKEKFEKNFPTKEEYWLRGATSLKKAFKSDS